MSAPAEWLAAVAEPTRLAVLLALTADRLTASELGRVVGSDQPTLVHHLNRPKAAGLVVADREGRFIRYALADAGVRATATQLVLTHKSGVTVTIPLV